MADQNLPTRSDETKSAELSTPQTEQIGAAQPDETPLDVPTEHATDLADKQDENVARDAAKKKRRRRRHKLQKMALKWMFPNIDKQLRDLSDDSDDPNIEDLLDSEDEKVTSPAAQIFDPEPEEKKPDVIYRAELYSYHNRHDGRWTADLQDNLEDREQIVVIEGDSVTKSSSVLEVTTLFATTERLSSFIDDDIVTRRKFGQYRKPVLVRAKIRTYITVRSASLLQVLQRVVTYYPVLANWRDNLVLQEPFCMLLHYQDELIKYRDALRTPPQQAETDATACDHLTQLLDLLSHQHGPDVEAEISRWRGNAPLCTFEWIWLLFKPGTRVIRVEDGIPSAYIVQWHSREVLSGEDAITKPPEFNAYRLDFSDPPKPLTVAMWCLDFDGRLISRHREQVVIQPFTGERKITSLPICPEKFWQDAMFDTGKLPIQDSLIKNGERFVRLTKRSHCHYKGLTLGFPKQQVDERVMIDSEHFYCNTEEGRELAPKLGISDTENYNGDEEGFSSYRRYRSYSTAPDHFERASKCESSKSPYRAFDNIDPTKDQLSNLQLSLCRTKVWGFVLNSRKWEQLSVRCIEPPQFKDRLIDDLIIDDELKKMIQSLAKSYTSGNGRWSADFIQDKGEGQILLLHGKPGVGKTTTAECVAELTGRPLLPLTCGDLGIEPLKVEENLMKWFKVGTRWEAIVLIDEAEVYLEARETTDLQRNSLVSIFLRALDYYKGILFLTTNRVGTFDDAFVSRIHLIVHYPDFSEADREKIWQKFFTKLSKDRPSIRVDDGARYYAMKGDEVKNLGWNGREIRNAFSTAVALAEDEDQRDADNKIMLYEHHLRPVVKMSAKFKEKFKDIQGMSEEQLAKTKYLRSEAGVSEEILKGKKHSIDSTIGSDIYSRAHNDGQHPKRLRT